MFVGRNKEISKLEDFVFNSKKQFLYIYGKRGIGKTSLIYQFINKHRARLDNKIVTLNAYDFDSLPYDFLNSDKDIMVIDDYYEYSGDTAISIAIPIRSFKNIIAHSTAKKVILLSPEPPYFFNETQDGRFDYLEISALTKQELDSLFKVAFNIKNKINLSDFYSYFDNNPRSILIALNYLNKTNFENTTELIDFINKPIKQSGLIDINGNPLSSETEESKIITQTISVVNTSLIERINSNPSLIYQITPRKFEELVAELLEKQGFKANLTKQTRDGGKDIFVAQNSSLGNFLYYVECKQYAPDNPVGINLVRELYGTISADRATAGLLVTSSYFTKDAINFTQNLQHQLSLKGFIDLKKWIEEVCKK